MAKKTISVTKHALVPKHSKVSEKEKKEVLEKHKITVGELPKITRKDPALASMDVKEGDVIKIIRKSPTAGETIFYRCVIDA